MVPFQDKSSIVMTGSSQSGKTFLLRDILLHADQMFQTPPTICIFVFTHWQEAYESIRKKWGDRVLFTQRIPEESQVEAIMRGHKHGVFVADDKCDQVEKNPFFRNLLCRLGHHCRMSSFCLLQDANFTGKASSALKKNFHVTIVMRSPRERSFVRALALQTGDYRCLMHAYDDAVKEKYGYICIDLHPGADPEYRYRTNIVPSDKHHCVVYKPKKEEDK